MCFSATASFGASIVLTIIGVAAIKKTHHPSQFLFASIPFIFGIQQFAEGVLWLTLPHADAIGTQKTATYIFLFFAQILWPVWVPIAILFLEKNSTRKNIQKIFVLVGLTAGLYLAYCLTTFNVEAKIIGKHITYFQNYPPFLKNYSILFYGLATIVPPLFSHVKNIWMLGVSILISYVITAIFYEQYILSVWCFFSSIISLSIYIVMIEIENEKKVKSITIY